MTPTQRQAITSIKRRIELARDGGQPDHQIRAGLTSDIEGWCPQAVGIAFEEMRAAIDREKR